MAVCVTVFPGLTMVNLKQVRKDVERFVRSIDREYYRNWAGLKEEMNTTAIYEKYRPLFRRSLIRSIREMRREAEGSEGRRLRYLEAILADSCLKNGVRQLTDRKETKEAKMSIKVDGEEIPFRLAAVKMVNEDDRAKRSKIFEERNKAIEKLNTVLARRMENLHSLSKSLGYDNYAHLYSDTKGIDFSSLQGKLNKLIYRTEDLYIDKMNDRLGKIGISLEEAEKHDIGYFVRAKEFDQYFRKEEAVPTLKKTLKGMGIDLAKQKNIILDTEEREKKTPRAFCACLEVPEKVMLVIMPIGGHDDYDSLFHEAGHAEHFANVSKKEDMEYKYLGDNSVTESYAFLLEYLITNKNWLRKYVPMEDASAYLEFVYLLKLLMVRRYIAKLNYELALHAKGMKGMDEIYAKTLESILKYKHPTSHYLIDLDDGFYCAQYLRAWIFEAQLRSALKEKFGEEWFLNPKAGRFLKDLWASGQKYDVEELARMTGFAGLDVDPLLEELEENLS